MVVDQPAVQETILVVEDDVLVRMPIAQYLRDCGYIVFSDIDMPGFMDGFGLSKWIHEHRPGLDVILVGTVPRAVNAAKELCEEGPLPKPYEPQAVHDHIRRLLAARKAKGRP